MRQLLPEPHEVDPHQAHAVAHRPAPGGRPWVMLNVITSVDGSTALGGVSGPLGSAADKLVFGALRASADVIMAGATTVTAERYRTPRTSEALQAVRTGRGQRALPRIAVVSGSLSMPLDLDMFTDPAERPIVVTTSDADPGRLDAVKAVADVIQAGEYGRVDLPAAMSVLHGEGAVVLCEGGATLNGHLMAADLVDEVNVSVAATLAGGHGPRLAVADSEVARPLTLAHLWEDSGMLLARYLVDRT